MISPGCSLNQSVWGNVWILGLSEGAIYGSASVSIEISLRTHVGQSGVVVLSHLVSGHRRGALRHFAANLAQFFGNQRHCRRCLAIERSKRSPDLVKRLANVSAIPDAILCFKLFCSHQGSRVYSDLAIAAYGAVPVTCPVRRLCTICSCREENSTRCSNLTARRSAGFSNSMTQGRWWMACTSQLRSAVAPSRITRPRWHSQ